MTRDTTMWLNGRFLPYNDARVPFDDRWDAVSDTCRTVNGRPFLVENHVSRLFDSLKFLRIEPDETPEELVRVTHELCRLNDDVRGSDGDFWVNYRVSRRGPPQRGTNRAETVAVSFALLAFAEFARDYTYGQSLVIPWVRQIPRQVRSSRVKSPYATWAHFVTAQLEVEQLETGAKALLLDLDGNLAETVDGNIFVLRGTHLLTPPCFEAIEGYSRGVTIELARGLGLDVKEAVLQVYDAVTADEVLVTTTGFCAVPVTRINGYTIGDGHPGETWRRLIDAWSGVLGLDPVAQARANLSPDELARLNELERRSGGTAVAEAVA